MPPAVFEPAIPANERPQTHAIDRAATGIGMYVLTNRKRYNQLISLSTLQNYVLLSFDTLYTIYPG
jgi:hypothetical protein